MLKIIHIVRRDKTPCVQTISMHSDSLYFASSIYVPALLCTSSFLFFFIRDTPTKLLKHFISRTITFLLWALLIPHASAPYNAVGIITPLYRHFLHLSPICYCSALPTLYSSHIHSMYHIPFTSFILSHFWPQVLITIHCL